MAPAALALAVGAGQPGHLLRQHLLEPSEVDGLRRRAAILLLSAMSSAASAIPSAASPRRWNWPERAIVGRLFLGVAAGDPHPETSSARTSESCVRRYMTGANG